MRKRSESRSSCSSRYLICSAKSHIILESLIMGCEVVSVYNDEVVGKIGLPTFAIHDLFARDHR